MNRAESVSPSMSRSIVCILGLVAIASRCIAQTPQIDWQHVRPRPADRPEYLNALIAADSRFVAVGGTPFYLGGAVGSAMVVSSTDGYQWHASLTHLDRQLSSVAFGAGQWVVCGDDGLLFTSADTTNWVDRTYPNVSHDLQNLVYGAGRFIAFAAYRDLLYHSSNGVNWAAMDVPGVSQVQRACYVNGVFVAGGTNGNVLFSTYGLSWQVRKTPTDSWIGPIAFGKGRYVAGGHQCVLYSFDAITWTVITVPIAVRDITYTEGWFIAVGSNPSRMLVSADAVKWQAPLVVPAADYGLESLACLQSTVVVAAGANLYLGSVGIPEDYRARLHILGTDQLEFWGDPGVEYRLERSSDLGSWAPVSDWRDGLGDYLLWDWQEPTTAPCFWRAARRPVPSRAEH
jgi:hypothetical protein